MLPLILFGYLTAVGGLLSWGFRKWNDIVVGESCCRHYTDWSRNVYELPNRCGMADPRGSFGVIWFYLGWAAFGTTGVLFALKLEGERTCGGLRGDNATVTVMARIARQELWICHS
jgi:hypothetical protein